MEMRGRIVMDFLDMTILLKLKSGMQNDFDILSHIQKRFNMPVTPGAVYSCMCRLERDGLVRKVRLREKKVYALTRDGEEKSGTLMDMRDKVLGLVADLFV